MTSKKTTNMQNNSKIFKDDHFYEPLDDLDLPPATRLLDEESSKPMTEGPKREFSWLEYTCFFIIGISMMWTWSMILQAVPYFQRRFKSNPWILRNFQAYNLVVFAVTISGFTIGLSRLKLKVKASYTDILKAALIAKIFVAASLTLSTLAAFNIPAEIYFFFLLSMVLITGIANASSQQAAFAFVASFGKTEYAPTIMTGEALASLLPSTIEILSALAFPSTYFDNSETIAITNPQTPILTTTYFFTGIVLGITALIALHILTQRHKTQQSHITNHQQHSLQNMWKKLKWTATANFLCLCISSISPVFASKITSQSPSQSATTSILLRPQAFIPLAIVLWNIGDLLGSILSLFSHFLIRRPYLLTTVSLTRIIFIPLYLMCNIDGRGSIAGDWFYLVVVQFVFGLSHGWVSGCCMSGVPVWVEEEEREQAGAFMGGSLVGGLVVGSLLGLGAAQV